MLDFRLKSFHAYEKMPMPDFGPDLSGLDLEHMLYYQKTTDKQYRDWEDVPDKIKDTFDRLGVPEAERKYLAGSSAQYESEVVYHNMRDEFEKLGDYLYRYGYCLARISRYCEGILQYFG